MSEVKREFYIHLDEDRAAAFAWRSLDAEARFRTSK